jgi:hypothetical protein
VANAENKLQKISGSVEEFLDNIADEQQRADAKTLCLLMEKMTGKKPEMWGYSIIGFGNYHYKYESGREGDSGVIGFSPRKNNLVLYIVNGYEDYGPLLEKLGKHSIGKSCLYIKRLSDVDMSVLQEMLKRSIEHMKRTYQTDLD